MAGENTYFESDGKSVNVDLLGTVAANQLAYVDGWLGIAEVGGVSGEMIALNVDMREYQFTVPSGLAVSKGDIVYIEVAQVTNGTIADAGYSTTAGAGKIAAFKATMDKNVDNVVTGVLLGQFAS
jgi:hypothetical protein